MTLPTYMRAITQHSLGDPDVLILVELPTPTPEADQLLVRVKATALNRADLLQRRGKYPPPPGESTVLGLEIAGDVVAVGDNVTRYQINDRVMGLVGGGSYAEYCVINQDVAMPIPASLSYEEAAAIPEAFLTASEALFSLGNLQPAETVLIHAGASGVGSAAIQLAKAIGATVYTTVGSLEKKTLALKLGAEKAILYKEENFPEQIPEGVDVIIDFVGASILMQHLRLLKINGRLICVGLMGGKNTEIDLTPIQKNRLQIKGLSMRTRPLSEKQQISQHFIQKWLPLFSNGILQPIIDRVFPFDHVQQAHERMEKNENRGKIILRVSI